MSLLWFLLIGLLAGWLAGTLVKGRGFGWLTNMIVGVIGGAHWRIRLPAGRRGYGQHTG